MTATVDIPGLGKVSRNRAIQIEIADEFGHLDEFEIADAIERLPYDGKTLRNALSSWMRLGGVERIGPGVYRWTA